MTAVSSETGAPGAARPSPTRQKRLRFSEFATSRTPAGNVTCRVTLELGAKKVAGEATGVASSAGDTRLGAQAAIAAIETFTNRALTFELNGVRVVRAFDTNVVIVSVVHHIEGRRERLLGCYLAESDIVRGAALAVLNATNRLVSSYIVTR